MPLFRFKAPLSLFFLFLLTACSHTDHAQCGTDVHSTMTQVSTIQALLKGDYDGHETFGELSKHGDFGIGTFEAVDGEMVELDGRFYQAKADGTVVNVQANMKTPFAEVSFFHARSKTRLDGLVSNLGELLAMLNGLMTSPNHPYAIKVSGTFDFITVRSVPRQTKPYQPLTEVVKHQSVFRFDKIKGTLVGYWLPESMDNLNMPGYHLHFISSDGNHGGHLLDCSLSKADMEVDCIGGVDLIIPLNVALQNKHHEETLKKELDLVEKAGH